MTILRPYCVVGRMHLRRWQTLLLLAVAWIVGGCAAAPKVPEPPPPQLATTTQAGDTTVVAVSPPAGPCCKQTLPEFLGITGLIKATCAGIDRLRNRLGTVFPGIEPGPPVLAITDPANSDPNQPPAVQSAAAIKAEEDAAPQKIKALRFLAGVGCGGCYPGVEESFLAALDDCTEAVRYEAVKALRTAAGNPCHLCRSDACCSPKVLRKLSSIAYDTTDSGCYKEPSARVRRVARLAMNACGGTVPADSMVPQEGPAEEPEMGEEAPPGGLAAGAPPHQQPFTIASAMAVLRPGSGSPEPIVDLSALRGTVAARVNGELVYWDEVLARIPPSSADLAAWPETWPRSRLDEALHRAIDSRLLSQDARRQMPPEEIARVVYQAVQGSGASQPAQGIPVVAASASQDEVLAGEWARRCAVVSPELTRQELYDFYRANFEKYRDPGHVRWEQLSARLDRFASREEAERTLAYVRAKILGGNPQWPPGINLEAIETSNREVATVAGLPEGVVRRAVTLSPLGQTSPILQDAAGLHLVRVLERREPRTRPLDEVIEAVRADVLQQRHAQAVEEILRQLRRQADVWIAPVAPVAAAPAIGLSEPGGAPAPLQASPAPAAGRAQPSVLQAAGRAPAASLPAVIAQPPCNCR